jgi:hypothetical protein
VSNLQWLLRQPEAFRDNMCKLVQLRIEELLIQSKEDSGSTFDFTKMNEVSAIFFFRLHLLIRLLCTLAVAMIHSGHR